MKQWLRRLAAISCLLAMCLLAGCAADNPPEEPAPPVADAAEDVAIETDFGTLRYPEQWSGLFKTDQTEEKGRLRVTFIADVHQKEYTLFTVVIGQGSGTQVGELLDESGEKRPVYMEVAEMEADSSLEDGEQQRLYAMQEDLNYVIDHLQ